MKTIAQPHAGVLDVSHELERKGSPLSAPANNSIWLLDDDLSMLKALGRLMDSAGFDVEKFSDPVAFLARLEHASCRLAVLDVWMPRMNGLEVQACLRRDSPATQVIFVTGRDDPLMRQTAIEAGAFAFLAKPFDDEVLVQLIREAVAT
jgi:FixJ family two-component response regulator